MFPCTFSSASLTPHNFLTWIFLFCIKARQSNEICLRNSEGLPHYLSSARRILLSTCVTEVKSFSFIVSFHSLFFLVRFPFYNHWLLLSHSCLLFIYIWLSVEHEIKEFYDTAPLLFALSTAGRKAQTAEHRCLWSKNSFCRDPGFPKDLTNSMDHRLFEKLIVAQLVKHTLPFMIFEVSEMYFSILECLLVWVRCRSADLLLQLPFCRIRK
jgi:hypothetical protein